MEEQRGLQYQWPRWQGQRLGTCHCLPLQPHPIATALGEGLAQAPWAGSRADSKSCRGSNVKVRKGLSGRESEGEGRCDLEKTIWSWNRKEKQEGKKKKAGGGRDVGQTNQKQSNNNIRHKLRSFLHWYYKPKIPPGKEGKHWVKTRGKISLCLKASCWDEFSLCIHTLYLGAVRCWVWNVFMIFCSQINVQFCSKIVFFYLPRAGTYTAKAKCHSYLLEIFCSG